MSDKLYKVNEIFYSIQGEGSFAGQAQVFLRLATCNLVCHFCDTEFESFNLMSANEIVEIIETFPRDATISLTGGEPLLQVDENLFEALKITGRKLHVETNGTVATQLEWDWICCSPKVAEHAIKLRGTNELRYVRFPGQPIPEPRLRANEKFISPAFDEMVILKNIEFTSLCEHHMLPFSGIASIGYIPDNKVVGISKLVRVVHTFAKRLQIQERMTRQIAEVIQYALQPVGVGVVVEARHACMGCRGVKQPTARMVTSSMLGAFRKDQKARNEFLSMVNGTVL